MNTVQLECFLEVASTLSFAQAAMRLNMTQPAVSKQVKSLEGELGVRLFERTTRSVALTPAAEGFLQDATEMLTLMRDSVERATHLRMDAESTIRVGYVDSVELVMLTNVWKKMRAERIRVHPFLHNGLQDANVNEVAQGKLDVALGLSGLFHEVDGVAFEKLDDATLRCVLPARNKLVARGSVSFDDLAGMPQAHCAPADLRQRAAHDDHLRTMLAHTSDETFMCSSVAEACSIVSAGLAFTLVPSPYIMPSRGVRDVALQESRTVPYGLFVREKNRSAIVDAFIRVLKDLHRPE